VRVSRALKTVSHCPQRTFPPAALRCSGPIRKKVWQLGHSVYMVSGPWLSAAWMGLRSCKFRSRLLAEAFQTDPALLDLAPYYSKALVVGGFDGRGLFFEDAGEEQAATGA